MPLDQGAQVSRKPTRHGTQTTTTPVITRGVGGWAHSYQHLWWAPGLSAHSGGAPRATRAHDTTPMDPSRKRPLEDISPDKGSAVTYMQKCRRSDLLSSSPCLPLYFRETAAARRRGAHISRVTATKAPPTEPTQAQHSTAAPQHSSSRSAANS